MNKEKLQKLSKLASNLTILYVEDDKLIRDNYTEILKSHFKNVLITDNGNDALRIYNENRVDIAILDISIPGINGLNLASKIRKKDADIQIIMLTAYSEREKLIQAVNLQLFAYLIKPVEYEDFNKVLKSIIKIFEKDNFLLLTNDFKWNKDTNELFYKYTKIKLTNKEQKIVSLLCTYPNQYITAYEIALEIGEDDSLDEKKSNTITQLFSRFKNKTIKELNIKHFFIENVYGAGYKIILR